MRCIKKYTHQERKIDIGIDFSILMDYYFCTLDVKVCAEHDKPCKEENPKKDIALKAAQIPSDES